MKKILSIIAMMVIAVSAFAQIRPRVEITSVEINDGEENFEVMRMNDNGQYYLALGHLGVGDKVIQVVFDPATELFIPLGDNLTDAIASLESIQALFKEAPGTSMEVQGCLSILFPGDQLETVTVTHEKVLLSHHLRFSVEREGYIRSTYAGKSEFKPLVSGTKFYKKLHPKE